ncbi:hypothetical protein HC031_18150 [Planosporangium thailandense]|uniref:Uncharacterized protein n=1 Tax=Planosporangium thailandense TaxID=765197 RepID=A0ABX0XZX1_9ACTN|nr:hypothetical protein [Planosporangium thailandense]NJC71626.1 hypothetical protein [Planosporangium thailandense]
MEKYMSDLAMTVVFGRADRNSGNPRSVDVLANLYVGGSGVWAFHRLDADEHDRGPIKSLRIRSERDFTEEISAGFALMVGIEGARETATEPVGPGWAERDLDVSRQVLQKIGAPARDLNVGCLVTDLGGFGTELVEALSPLGWSLVVAAPVHDGRSTQWDR